ncbi:MAG TPA: TadE/TadG family type IV pilus assembly protein [Tianweitania sediminis]|jgi:hypothetical protein|nr:TadE/TadG family type IV pilus assembly protein [Tianweitania sediminis]
MFRKFQKDRRGNIAVTFTLAMLPVMGGVAGAVDYSSAFNRKAQLQNALDAAALAIGMQSLSGTSQAELSLLGQRVFSANVPEGMAASFRYLHSGTSTAIETSEWGNALLPDAGGASEDRILVKATAAQKRLLDWGEDWPVSASSVVRVTRGEEACVLALSRTATEAIKLQGSTQVRLDGCVVAANSYSDTAVSRGGSAVLSASCVYASGGTLGLNVSNAQLECGLPKERQPISRDPLAIMQPPEYGTCKSVPGGKQKTLQPGTYCDRTISGDVTLDPGTYILKGGQIRLGGNGRLSGTGVTIFLMEGASITVGANEVINLSAPTSGPYAGVTIFQSRDNAQDVKLNGGAGSQFVGFLYAPSAHVQYAGNDSMTGSGGCLRIVANTVEMTGNSDVASGCEDPLAGKKIHAGRTVSLMR